MKKSAFVFTAFLCVFSLIANAQATIVNAFPYNLTNGSLADATQVMGNFNEILNDTNANAAHNGANSDITSISGLTTALAHSLGGTVVYTAGTTGGSANAQTVSSTIPVTYALTTNNVVTAIAGATNTGPTTLAVDGTAATAVRKITPAGLVALSGNEIIVGGLYIFQYDGTYYELLNPVPHGVLLAVQTFTATGAGTYTPTAGMTKCIIKMQGAGGGSGGTTGTAGQNAAGGAGGGGDYLELLATSAQIGASASLSVGAAGAAGTSGVNSGGNGGDTTITINSGTAWKAGGGVGGGGKASSAAAQIAGTAGTGGVKTNGTNATLVVDVTGQNGGYGFSNGTSAPAAMPAPGGGAFLGRGGEMANSGTGTAGYNYGGGAGGSNNTSGSNQTGAAGAQGVIIIEEFQ